MSETRLLVRDASQEWSGCLHASWADQAVAALAADPVTFEELQAAMGRVVRPDETKPFLPNLRPGSSDEPYDAGVVIIDLAARLVVFESTYSAPGQRGSVTLHDNARQTTSWLHYHLADDWMFSSDVDGWQGLANGRRKAIASRPAIDARRVFYGRPLLEFIGRETHRAHLRREAIAAEDKVRRIAEHREWMARRARRSADAIDPANLTDEEVWADIPSGDGWHQSPFYNAIKDIHVAWMLTPRDDLGGMTAREVAFEHRDHVERDIQDQSHYWTLFGVAPPGLPRDSHAFRHAPFGTHEMVKYYDLVRELLWSSWQRLEKLPEATILSDYLMSELPRLEAVRDQWLDAPDPDCHGRTPRAIIEREQARLPEGMSGREAMIDPDCPCCQMMADEMSGPWFWHLDGCNMDDEFAFDIHCATREEWEAEERRREEFNRRFEAEWDERERLQVTSEYAGKDDAPSIWKRTFSFADAQSDAVAPVGVRVFGIGGKLAELIVDLRGEKGREGASPEALALIDRLNRDFGNFRSLLQSSEPAVAASLFDPVCDSFADGLANVAAYRPDLTDKCDNLTEELETLLDPAPPAPEWDDDIPF